MVLPTHVTPKLAWLFSLLCRALAFAAAARAGGAETGNDIEGDSSSRSSSTGGGSEVPPLPPPGTAMTADGPVQFAGNILDSPDVVWMDDCWTNEEVGCVAACLRSYSIVSQHKIQTTLMPHHSSYVHSTGRGRGKERRGVGEGKTCGGEDIRDTQNTSGNI